MVPLVLLTLACLWQGTFQLSQSDVDLLLRRLETVEDKALEQERINTHLKQRIVDLETKCVEKGKRFVMDEGPVAFTASVSPFVVEHVKTNEIIKFDTVITDIGGGYSNQTGVFVVPISGLYMFTSSLLDDNHATHGATVVHAEIVLSGRRLGRILAHSDPGNYRDQGAQTVLTYARQGEQVWIKNIDVNDVGLGGEFYSTFSGVLITPM